MKKYIILFSLFLSIIINSYSQTGSDYYIPLCVGNYGAFYTPESSSYGARTTIYYIKQIDTVLGEIVYLQEAYEISDNTPYDTSIFQQFWLREDDYGNILMVAVNMQGTGLIEDAMILPVAHKLIPNEYLTLGYNRSYFFGNETTYDTVLSVSATVGTYTNCILVRSTILENQSLKIIDDYYYAPNAGLVKNERQYHSPDPQEYVMSLTDILAVNCHLGIQNNELEDKNSITIYPNPASDIVNLEIKDVNIEILELNIYNILGVLVKTKTISNDINQINISDLNNGIYFLDLKSKDFTTKQKLIIKK
ncbi:MAG TPA: hypothetical protein DD434_09315 [Bacteroidales bacterium]|nr:hypothetical protein [Bacteroidales bacterium]